MSKKRILVVDDEKDVLTLLERRLSHEGFIVLKATNGKDAIKMAREHKPDLIILDIIMPDIDGGKVAETLKSDLKTKNIPIVFLTCLVTKDEEKAGKIIKGRHFIAKPYNPAELVATVHKLLS